MPLGLTSKQLRWDIIQPVPVLKCAGEWAEKSYYSLSLPMYAWMRCSRALCYQSLYSMNYWQIATKVGNIIGCCNLNTSSTTSHNNIRPPILKLICLFRLEVGTGSQQMFSGHSVKIFSGMIHMTLI
jgi:hypothetical protein